jgi:hypothetical protein
VQNRGSLEPRAAPPWLTRCSRRAKETATRKGCMSNELCPALVSGLTVQPCGELRCSAAGFLIIPLFDFVCVWNQRNKPSSSLSDRMTAVNVPFPAGEVVGSIPVPTMQTIIPEHRDWRKARFVPHLFEELQNIENQVAWFLAEQQKRCAKRQA